MTLIENICLKVEKVVDCQKSVTRSSWICKISGLLPALSVNIVELENEDDKITTLYGGPP
jgi:hypothetical protein